jgi:hypothetical protein
LLGSQWGKTKMQRSNGTREDPIYQPIH